MAQPQQYQPQYPQQYPQHDYPPQSHSPPYIQQAQSPQPYKNEAHGTEKPAMGAPVAASAHAAPPAHAQPHAHAPGAPLGTWNFGLFDCCSPFGTCCLGTWCPCVLYGRVHAREHGEPDSSGCNLMCCAFYALMCIGGSCILQCITRTSFRERYGIEGGSFGDFCGACCCSCCQLIQLDKESIVRTTGINPKTKQPYVSPTQMTYP